MQGIRRKLLAGVAALALLLPTPALPAVLFVGSELAEFTGTGTVSNIAFAYRSAWTRSAIQINRQSAVDPPTNRVTSPTWLAASGNFWLTWRIQGGSAGNTSGNIILAFMDGATQRLVLSGTGTSGSYNLRKRTGAGTYTTLATSASGSMPMTAVAGVPNKVDVYVDYQTVGTVLVYFNGTLVINYSGDPTTDGATTLNSYYLGPNTSGDETYVSEAIVVEQDTRSMGLYSLYPVASGTTQQWTPNTVGNVSKSSNNDVTYVTTGTNNYLSGWTTPTTIPAGTWNLLAVVQSVRLQRSGSGPQNFAYYCRSGGTDAASADFAANTGFTTYAQYVWTTNCATAAAWSISDITTGFNLGVKSRP